jgi:hypothetical protein
MVRAAVEGGKKVANAAAPTVTTAVNKAKGTLRRVFSRFF